MAYTRGPQTSSAEYTIQREQPYAIRLDDIDSVTAYKGEALPGTLPSAASWRIAKITTVGQDVTFEYADGNDSFDNIWDNRLSLSYS